MNALLDGRLKAILENPLSTYLIDLGFMKSSFRFTQNLGDLTWILDVQKSRWNSKEESSFTLNCGVFVPDVMEIYCNSEKPFKLRIEHCICSARIGMLTPQRKDIWWKLSDEDALENDLEIAQEIRDMIQKFMLPFLGKFKNIFDIIQFLESELDMKYKYIFPQSKAQRFAFAGIIYSKLGEGEKANNSLDLALEAAKNSPIETIVKKLGERI